VNVYDMFGGVSLRTRNIRLDFGTDPDPDLDPGSLFHFSIIER